MPWTSYAKTFSQIIGADTGSLKCSETRLDTLVIHFQSGKLLVRVMDARESPDTTHKDSPITALEMEKMIDQWAASRAKQLADNLGR